MLFFPIKWFMLGRSKNIKSTKHNEFNFVNTILKYFFYKLHLAKKILNFSHCMHGFLHSKSKLCTKSASKYQISKDNLTIV